MSKGKNVVISHIHRSIDVCVCRVAARATTESRFFAIRTTAMPTPRAFLTGVSGINKNNTFSKRLGFIGKELLKLIEAPTREPLIELLPPSLSANARQIL
jgi:hypothetical protein